MREKFGLEFHIVDSDLLRRLRRERGLYVNPWNHYPRLIVSVDWLKRDRPMRLLREFLPPTPRYPRAIDLLVVDEVHTCAPSGTGRYAVDSQRTRAIRALAPHCEHRLFLSATPHNGYLESFTALLEMLDDQRFARGVRPSEEQLARIMVRRLKRELPPRWDGTPRFPERRLIALEVDYGEDERRVHGLLERYARSRRDGGDESQQRQAADFVTTLLKKRLFSSPQAFAETLATHRQTMTGREPGLEGADAPRALGRYIERVEETVEDDAYAEVESDALEAVRRAARPLTQAEEGLLDEMQAWAGRAKDHADAKFAVFRRWVDGVLRPDGAWSDERVIVFTEYRDTQRWLVERLAAAGFPAERVEQLYGGMDTDRREHVKNIFQESSDLSPVRLLIATDPASEGISLQRHCHRLVHWEIPWNPNRLEQRNGRVDRYEQPADEVEVYHFVGAGYERSARGSLEGDLYFLHQAAEKVERIREDLGSAGPVLADQVTEAMLGRRAELTDTEPELRRRRSARLKVERDLVARLERLSRALVGSRDQLHLSPETVERVVRTGLLLAHRRDLHEVPPPDGLDARCFRLPELPGAWAEARNAGLTHPVTGKERPVTFDGDAAAGRTDVVLLHLGHRLVQRLFRGRRRAGAGRRLAVRRTRRADQAAALAAGVSRGLRRGRLRRGHGQPALRRRTEDHRSARPRLPRSSRAVDREGPSRQRRPVLLLPPPRPRPRPRRPRRQPRHQHHRPGRYPRGRVGPDRGLGLVRLPRGQVPEVARHRVPGDLPRLGRPHRERRTERPRRPRGTRHHTVA